MADKRIPHIYLKDINSIIESLDGPGPAGECLWMTGDIKVTDGDIVYTLVYEDDTWLLDTEQTTTKE